jgi:YHS domain-containing protein
LLFLGLLLYVCYRIILSLTSDKKPLTKSGRDNDPGEETYRDPVCGVYISEETAVIGKHDGKRYYFCSMDCLEKYREQIDHISPP